MYVCMYVCIYADYICIYTYMQHETQFTTRKPLALQSAAVNMHNTHNGVLQKLP